MRYRISFWMTFLFISSLLFISCSKKSGGCHWDVLPPILIFQLKLDNELVSDRDFLSAVKVSYYDGNEKRYLNGLTLSDTVHTGSVVNSFISTRGMAGGIKTFFFEYPDNSPTDTLYIDYSIPSASTNCSYILNEIKFDNKVPEINGDIKARYPDFTVYVFSN